MKITRDQGQKFSYLYHRPYVLKECMYIKLCITENLNFFDRSISSDLRGNDYKDKIIILNISNTGRKTNLYKHEHEICKL